MKLLDILCDPSRASIDVGAKIGMYTYRHLSHSPRVNAFEPIPILHTMLGRVFARQRVTIMPVALSDTPGRATMRIPYDRKGEVKFGRSTIERSNPLTHDDVARVDEIDVEVQTLDGCAVTGVGFIKIDVEGHELAVLRGALETLRRDRPALLVEASEHHHPGAVAELRELMTAEGYVGLFGRQRKLVDLATVTDLGALQRENIANFIFIHASKPEARARIAARFR
jgi:FkbM family methyltransferase